MGAYTALCRRVAIRYSGCSPEKPTMNDAAERLSCAEARNQFDDLLDRTVKHKERVLLTRRGKPVAALVPIGDVKFLEARRPRSTAAPGRSSSRAGRRLFRGRRSRRNSASEFSGVTYRIEFTPAARRQF